MSLLDPSVARVDSVPAMQLLLSSCVSCPRCDALILELSATVHRTILILVQANTTFAALEGAADAAGTDLPGDQERPEVPTFTSISVRIAFSRPTTTIVEMDSALWHCLAGD